MANIGFIALILALLASLYSAITHVFEAKGKRRKSISGARYGLYACFGFTTLAALVLMLGLLTHNFQIEYVASYTSRDMSFPYLVSAFWAGNTGSLLFWAWLLAIFALIVVKQGRRINGQLLSYAAAVIMFAQTFFLLLLVSVSNPFSKLAFMPADGRGLNPMLENPGMIFHPPALLAGYVGLTIPFAFAVAALLLRKPGDDWIAPARKWTLLSWLLLGAGNIIGAWWAYVELGWGGYWAWDPVENAGLMPWLVGTAFLHSIMMQRKKGIFKVWNMVLIILTFNLAIFGTFLTRSGVLSSVHTYGESALGPFFLCFLAITFIGSLSLLYYRRGILQSETQVENIVSREGTFWINNLLLVGATLIIFLGTVFPSISEVLWGTQMQAGEAFFNQAVGPVFLAIILLAGICAFIGWQRTAVKDLARKFLWPFLAAVIVLIILFATGIGQPYAVIAFSLCSFVLFSIVYEWLRETRIRRKSKSRNYFKAFWELLLGNRPRYGAYIVHIAIVLIAVGVIGSSFYDTEREAVLRPGDTAAIGDYSLIYSSLDIDQTRSKDIVTASVRLYKGDDFIKTMEPEKYFHRSYEQPVTEVAIRTTLAEDVYVILAGWGDDGSATFRILVNPLVIWIWIGGILLVAGGLLAFWPGKTVEQPVKRVSKGTESALLDDEIEMRVRQLRTDKAGYCPKCGAKREKNARYCSRCGAKLA